MKGLLKKLTGRSNIIGVKTNRMNKNNGTDDLEQDFHTLFHEHIDAVLELDPAGNILLYNQAFTTQFGYTDRDFTSSFVNTFIKNTMYGKRYYFNKALQGGTQSFNTICQRKNGEAVDINVTYIPIKTNDSVTGVYVILKDITEFKEKERELLLFQKNLNTTEKLGNIGSFHYDVMNDRTYCSKQKCTIFGINDEEDFAPTFAQILEFVHPDDRPKFEAAVQQALTNKLGYHLEHRIIRRDNTIRYVYEQADIILDENGQPARVIGFIQDITNSKLIEKRLMEKEKQLSNIYSHLDVGLWSINTETSELLLCSKGIEQICGYTAEEIENETPWSSVIHPDDLMAFLERQPKLADGSILRHQYRIIHKNGDIKWVQDYTIPVLDNNGALVRLDGLISDITEQKMMEEKMKHLSYHDYLTDLPNRRMFDEQLQHFTETFAHQKAKFAVMMLDLDRFKYINDTLGHPIGDELLKQISIRLSAFLTPNNIISRLGGDEFGILLTNIQSIESPINIAKKMIDHLKEPFHVNEYELHVTASIGISIFPEDGEQSDDLLRNADLALYKAKALGKNTYQIFSPSMSIEAFKLFSLERDLRSALNKKEMTLFYQPRVDTRSGKIVGAEALIRWKHPEWGIVLPKEFIPIAEESGFITHIEDWALKEVCGQLKKWKTKLLRTVPISINISAAHFMKHDWIDTVEQTIREARILPNDLEFEITESAFLNNEESVKNTIHLLKGMGVKVSLDDFGTGYSSLSYLSKFPFDVIKIDKSFIHNMHHSSEDFFIAKSIIYLAKGLHFKVVAEGVETAEQLKLLKKEDCDQIQGYLFSRPIPAAEFEAFLQSGILQPADPKLKEKQNKRKHYRINFPHPLYAEMTLVSIAGRPMNLGKSNVLIEDISIGGLRYFSLLKLPVRQDIILEFETELLGEPIKLTGQIVWKEEVNDDITEYGIELMMDKREEDTFSTLLDAFSILLKNGTSLPEYKMITEDKYEYFQTLKN